MDESKARAVTMLGVGEVETQLDDLEIPVAELAPEKRIDQIRGFMEAVRSQSVIDLVDGLREAGSDPAVFERFGGAAIRALIFALGAGVCSLELSKRPDPGLLRAININEDKAGSVPDLIGECAIALGALGRERDIGAGRGHRCECEANRICAVLLGDLDGINNVALGLGHLLAFGVADQRVDVDLAEGNAVPELL